jgi:fucose 4-O-acetylase-like acetyltransferase
MVVFGAMARDESLDRAKGLAILLVVFGHIVARADPAGVDWYEPLRRAVYAFHMPFFLYLSGMAAAFSGAAFGPLAAWPRLVAGRARRLLVPFFGLGLAILAAKLAASRVMFVDNAPKNLSSGLDGLFWHTDRSPAHSIWYVFVLFVFSAAAPLLVRAGGLRLALAAGVLVYCLPCPPLLYADELGRYFIFFTLGLAAGAAPGWMMWLDRHWRRLGLGFLGLLGCIVAFGNFVSFPVTLLLTGALSMPVLHGLVRNLSETPARIFLYLGRYSFMIYLFNTLFIGLAKGLLLRVTDWDGAHFLPFAIALAFAGTLGPVALKEAAFRRAPLLDRLTSCARHGARPGY